MSRGPDPRPNAIEEVLLRHPDLVEVSVVGRPHPDWGEEVVAFVVACPAANVAPEELDRLCLDYTARFKRSRVGCAAQEQLRQGPQNRAASHMGPVRQKWL
jgi:long-chain acyl-CoA synthetase